VFFGGGSDRVHLRAACVSSVGKTQEECD
jgi:hypothetical protein